MNRTLKLSMLTALALGSGHAMAVSLGQAQVKSALGQPLVVEVPLNPASPSELRHLTVRLASSDAYARAGITDGRTSVPLHFSVVNHGSGKVIRITSTAPIGNPYLDLLLEVDADGSKSVREVAILLDPPGMSTPAPAPAPAPAAEPAASPAQRPGKRGQTSSAPPSSSRTSTRSAGAGNGKYGPVQPGQTLTGIARETLPAGVDISQMLLAYQQANPDAFYRDNVNALKSGAVLRVPDAADARSMAAAAAVAEVHRQNSDWRAGSTSKPVALADAGSRPASINSSGNATGGQGDRLALVPAKDGNRGTPSTSAGSKGESAKDLRQELLRTKENVASLQQQGADLKTRLQDLNDINDKNKSLLTLKDSQIADLESKLAAARKSADLPPVASTLATAQAGMPAAAASAPMAEAGSARGLGTEPTLEPATATSTMGSASSAATASGMPAATSVAASRPAPVAPATRPLSKPSPMATRVEQPWYMQAWAWAVAAGVVVVLLLLALLGRRKSARTAPVAGSSLADRFGAGTPPVNQPDDDATLSEEDLDQDELLDQLAEHPDDIHLHFELVALYYSRRDVEHFEAAAEAMHAHITDPQQSEWQDVVHMGEDLTPQHPLFAMHEEVPVSNLDTRQTFDIDDYAEEGESVVIPPSPQTAPVSEYNFNFDLTSPRTGTASEAHADAQDMAFETEPAIEEGERSDLSSTGSSATDYDSSFDPDEFNDDPIDTKLDLARAYMDMGDADGARAMLEEVINEGSQVQQDTARGLLENMA